MSKTHLLTIILLQNYFPTITSLEFVFKNLLEKYNKKLIFFTVLPHLYLISKTPLPHPSPYSKPHLRNTTIHLPSSTSFPPSTCLKSLISLSSFHLKNNYLPLIYLNLYLKTHLRVRNSLLSLIPPHSPHLNFHLQTCLHTVILLLYSKSHLMR